MKNTRFTGLRRFKSDYGVTKTGIFITMAGPDISENAVRTDEIIDEAVKRLAVDIESFTAEQVNAIFEIADIVEVFNYFFKIVQSDNNPELYFTSDDVWKGYQVKLLRNTQIWKAYPRNEPKEPLPPYLEYKGGTVPSFLMSYCGYTYCEALAFLYLGYNLDKAET